MLDQTLTIVLVGGSGTRLQPLPEHRTKPAVHFRGKYRIIEKGVSIPDGVQIGVNPKQDASRFTIFDKGIVVVPQHYNFE